MLFINEGYQVELEEVSDILKKLIYFDIQKKDLYEDLENFYLCNELFETKRKQIDQMRNGEIYLACVFPVSLGASSRSVKLQSYFFICVKHVIDSNRFKERPCDFIPASLAT